MRFCRSCKVPPFDVRTLSLVCTTRWRRPSQESYSTLKSFRRFIQFKKSDTRISVKFYRDRILFDTRTGLKSSSYSELTHRVCGSCNKASTVYSPWSVGTTSGSSSNLTKESKLRQRCNILGRITGMALFPFVCGITSQRGLHPRRTSTVPGIPHSTASVWKRWDDSFHSPVLSHVLTRIKEGRYGDLLISEVDISPCSCSGGEIDKIISPRHLDQVYSQEHITI